MTQEVYRVFDALETRPAAVDTFPDEENEIGPIGWWAVFHTLTVQLNYSLDEELEAYKQGIEHTLRNFAEYEGEETVDERKDVFIDELERKRDEMKEGRLFPI